MVVFALISSTLKAEAPIKDKIFVGLNRVPHHALVTKSMLPKNRIEWKKNIFKPLDLPSLKNKGCPDLISVFDGTKGCIAFYINCYRDDELTFSELVEFIHNEVVMRVNYV